MTIEIDGISIYLKICFSSLNSRRFRVFVGVGRGIFPIKNQPVHRQYPGTIRIPFVKTTKKISTLRVAQLSISGDGWFSKSRPADVLMDASRRLFPRTVAIQSGLFFKSIRMTTWRRIRAVAKTHGARERKRPIVWKPTKNLRNAETEQRQPTAQRYVHGFPDNPITFRLSVALRGGSVETSRAPATDYKYAQSRRTQVRAIWDGQGLRRIVAR